MNCNPLISRTKHLLALLFISSSVLLPQALSAHGSEQENKPPMVKNLGQWDPRALFRMSIGGGEVWLEKSGLTFHFRNAEDMDKLHQLHHGQIPATAYSGIRSHVFQQQFTGTNPQCETVMEEMAPYYHNYFLGNDPAGWKGNVPVAFAVRYKSFFNGIDLRVSSNHGYFKTDFIVSPGANPADIRWNYAAIEPQLRDGKLYFNSHAGEIVEHIPEAYQYINGEKIIVTCEYIRSKTAWSFRIGKNYNPAYELIIDPTLIFSTLTGSTADNWGFTATYDNSGNLYAGGVVFGTGYPTTTGAFDLSFNSGTTDVAITKFSSNGSARIYSTYLGGSNSEGPHSLIVNAADELHVMGTTSSSGFPTTAGCYDNSFNGGSSISVNGISYSAGSDIFVTKFNASGSALIASTFVGGTGNDGVNSATTLNYNYADQMRGEIILDAAGDVYVTSSTLSSNFPTTAGSLAQTLSGTQDGCAFRLNSTLSTMVWGTYLGGTSTDAGYSIKVAASGSVYIGGGTRSTNFPTTAGTLHPAQTGGTADGFITNLNGNNGAMIASTYVGTNNYDQVYMLELDDDDDVYVTGQTLGAYPVSGGVYSVTSGKQFIHKITPDLTATAYSTVFGSGAGTDIDISITAFLVDDCENVYVSGWGGNTNNEGSTFNLPVTANAYDNTTDGSDFYFFVLERNAINQLYGTFFGGTAAEHVDGGTSRFDPNGTIYQAVCAACGSGSNFPTTPGVVGPTDLSSNCNLGAIKMEFDFTGIIADASAAPNIIACDPPFDVTFTGAGNAVHHVWDFGDGTGSSTLANPTYTFVDTGSYTIMYIAIDSSTCNIADTAYLSVEILESETFSAIIDIPPFDPCQGNNLTVDLQFTGSGADSLSWNMGDGTVYTDDTLVTHTYTAQGTYIITLTAWDFTCNRTESITDTVSYNATTVVANANASPNVISCEPPYTVNFNSGSTSPDHFWDFDDAAGSTSTLSNPSFTFSDTGSYNIMYVAIDSSSCNIADTAFLSVVILQPKEFDASLSSTPPAPCSDTVLVDIQFTGTGADSLIWDMGEGTVFTNDTLINFVYTVPGTYTITMTAFDLVCNKTEVITQTVEVQGSVMQGIVAVPNVFSPNNDAYNKEFVAFYSNLPGVDALESMEVYHVEIYNRWGKKVFESEGSKLKWDGEIDGKPANEGVYFYILTYQRKCWDDEPTTVNGHVTVMRK